jgi:hypothetical protein
MKIDGGIHVERRDPSDGDGRYRITTRTGKELGRPDTLNINGNRPFAFGASAPGVVVEFGADPGTTTEITYSAPRGKNSNSHATIRL